MHGEGSGYVAGDPYGQCVRCALTYRLSEFRTEWTGVRVCKDCVDPRPGDVDPPYIYPEGIPREDAQPKMPEVEQAPITADDL
jgi:hypothetical protein